MCMLHENREPGEADMEQSLWLDKRKDTRGNWSDFWGCRWLKLQVIRREHTKNRVFGDVDVYHWTSTFDLMDPIRVDRMFVNKSL